LKILLVRLRQIGDVVFTTPLVAAVRRRYPDAHLTYVVETAAAPVVANNPHLDHVLVVPPRRGLRSLVADLDLGRQLRSDRYDLAIDFHGGPRAALLTWLSAAPVRVGYNVAGRSWIYTKVVDRPRVLRRRHSVENQWDLLAALGIEPLTPERNPVEMALDQDAVANVERRLVQSGVRRDHEIVVVHVSASSPFRRWPLASFVDTVAALARTPGRRIVVTSGPSEQDAARNVIDAAQARLGAAAHRVLSSGDFSLAELKAIVDRSALFIGGDSGPLHIAATTEAPIVALFGPTPSERSSPWRSPSIPSELVEVNGLPCRPCDQRVCEPGDFRCLTRIEASQVVAAAERALALAAARSPQERQGHA
jgi:predicted lipopolysaccharide heptosyltransferase III